MTEGRSRLGRRSYLASLPPKQIKSVIKKHDDFFFVCNDLSRVPDKAVPMTIAPGHAAWTEHKL